MTATEIILLNLLIGVMGLSIGKIWGSRGYLSIKTSISVLETKLNGIDHRLERLEQKIDATNTKN